MTRYVPVHEQSEEDKKWMQEALVMARQAFEAAEVPVGSVFVRNGDVIARARNRTNELMNVSGFMAVAAILILSRRQQDMPNLRPLTIFFHFTLPKTLTSPSRRIPDRLETTRLPKQRCM